MSFILHIETATKICSVALSENGKLVNEKTEYGDGYIHGERLTLLIQKLMSDKNINFSSLAAISISIGPGSYTGLRIGLSTVKGIAFALKCPIIPLNTLEIMAKSIRYDGKIFAMLDARRMEVYAYGINEVKNAIFSPAPVILDAESLSEFDPFLCLGDGAFKVKKIWTHRNVEFLDEFQINAGLQVELAFERFKNKDFATASTLVPDYLKEFQTTSS
ncbi:MAG: tRNA (adenosine(37)-N6)-threonylcarbamoyltransferase complex dimerization subunit type 1 TsaB [Bacteroidetes bacterium]|nr:tRNA (adenosine(37)-N6)-threonylcarbamoyltransferase complex dimerization subunit type 1 TsaB [Bacteroidota bacterium]